MIGTKHRLTLWWVVYDRGRVLLSKEIRRKEKLLPGEELKDDTLPRSVNLIRKYGDRSDAVYQSLLFKILTPYPKDGMPDSIQKRLLLRKNNMCPSPSIGTKRLVHRGARNIASIFLQEEMNVRQREYAVLREEFHRSRDFAYARDGSAKGPY